MVRNLLTVHSRTCHTGSPAASVDPEVFGPRVGIASVMRNTSKLWPGNRLRAKRLLEGWPKRIRHYQ